MDGALLTLVPILLAPVVMYIAIRAQRRLGSEAAGWVAAIPTTVPIAVLAVGLQSGDSAAAALTLSAASHVPAQICFALCFAAGLRRSGVALGFATATIAFLAVSLVIVFLPPQIALATAVIALLIGRRLAVTPIEPAAIDELDTEPKGPNAAAACTAAALVVGAVITVVRLAGPVIGGVIAAFPTLSSTIAVAITRSNGRNAGIAALTGLIRGLPCYFAFLVSVALLAVPLGTLVATLVGFGVSAATGWTLWVVRRDRIRALAEV